MAMDAEIKAIEPYPVDYKIYNIGDNLKLITEVGKEQFFTIKNRSVIYEEFKEDTTNWLLSAGGDYNAGDISDLLEPEDGTLYILALSVESDRNIEFRLHTPASEQLGGTKEVPDAVITPDKSPRNTPTVTAYAWGTSLIPNFKLKNPTEYTPIMVKLYYKGFKYTLEELPSKPTVYDTISLVHVRAGA